MEKITQITTYLSYFMQANLFHHLTLKKLMSDYLINWFTNASSGDSHKMTVSTEVTFLMVIPKNIRMPKNFLWIFLIYPKAKSQIKIPKKSLRKAWLQPNSSSSINQIKTSFKTFNVFQSNTLQEHISHKKKPKEDLNCIGPSWIHKLEMKFWPISFHNTKSKPT